MPPALDESVKERVRKLWLSGEARSDITAECRIGAGSVTNIVKEWKKSLEEVDLEGIRELAVHLKKENITFAQLMSISRHRNYVEKLGANNEQIESLIINLLEATK
jgi:hypothetical protein